MTDPDETATDATRLLVSGTAGDRRALDAMLPLVYDELHRLAVRYLSRERADHTLQPTALVHEAYLRLINQREADWRNRALFIGLAAGMMRRILVNYARDRAAAKRPGERERVPLSLVQDTSGEPNLDLIAVERALEQLAAIDERKARVVELKFFGGLTAEEIGEVIGVSRATVEREWSFARAWIHDAVEGTRQAGDQS